MLRAGAVEFAGGDNRVWAGAKGGEQDIRAESGAIVRRKEQRAGDTGSGGGDGRKDCCGGEESGGSPPRGKDRYGGSGAAARPHLRAHTSDDDVQRGL